MKEQIVDVAKATDFSVSYKDQAVNISVRVLDIVVHIDFCTDNVHISVDKKSNCKNMSQSVNNF